MKDWNYYYFSPTQKPSTQQLICLNTLNALLELYIKLY